MESPSVVERRSNRARGFANAACRSFLFAHMNKPARKVPVVTMTATSVNVFTGGSHDTRNRALCITQQIFRRNGADCQIGLAEKALPA